MLKRINWKAVLYFFVWITCMSGLFVLMGFIEIKKSALRCKEVKVLIPGNQNFIERDEINHILLQDGGPLAGRMLNKINIHNLENLLKANPFIEFAKVYADMEGTIRVNVIQREPLLRVLNMANQDFYIDKNGLKIPMSENFTARVLVANGFILENFGGSVDTVKTNIAGQLIKTALFIKNDTLWNDQIEQLYVTEAGIIELVPRVGKHKIILGNADSLETKFNNLLVFYKKAIPQFGWDTYKTINIRYTNQIVCEKSVTDSMKAVIAARAKADSIKMVADTATIPDTINIAQDTLTQDTITTAIVQ